VLNALAPIVIWFTGACARRLRLKQASNRPIPANHQSKENYTKARILHQGLGITSIELCFQYKRLWNSTAITYRLLARYANEHGNFVLIVALTCGAKS